MLDLIVYEKTLKGKWRSLLSAIETRLQELKKQFLIHIAKKAGEALEIAKSLTKDREATIVAVGGDGTLNEVMSGIENPETCTLGLIPAGTGNDFAGAAKIPLGLEALDLIVNGEPKYTDYIQFDDGKRSINIAGMGIDVDILQRVERRRGSKKSKYFRALLSSLAHYRPIEILAQADDGEVVHYKSLIACICNGFQFGGGIPICPDAVIDDNKLELLIADCPPRWKIPAALMKLMHGKMLSLPITHRVSCKSARITSPAGSFYAQYDGEIKECSSLTAHVVSGKLKMFRG